MAKSPEDYNDEQMRNGPLTRELIVALVRYWQEEHDLTPDGKAGPATVGSIEGSLPEKAPKKWPHWDGFMEEQPANREDLYEKFGNPGKYSADRVWRKDNIVECHGSSAMPGVPPRWYFQCHREVEAYMREAFRRAQIAAPEYKIERAASYVWRPIRHKRGGPLSVHSWGLAVDIDPHRNFSRRYARGKAPVAWGPEYMKTWPDGLPKAFVEAFQSCGFAWGSDWDEDGRTDDHTYLDPMHMEWVARDGNIFDV